MRSVPWLVPLIVLLLPACSLAPSPTPTLLLPPTPLPSLAPTPTVTGSSGETSPAWWARDLPPPKGALLTSGMRAPASWRTSDLNADGMKDWMLREANTAGYQSFVITESPGAIYDLLFVKSGITYLMNLTRGGDATIITGDRTGTLHLQTSGAANLNLDLPLRDRLNLAPGSEVSIGTSIPNDQCSDCQYFVNVHIAPFSGPGTYSSQQSGVYLIDVELVPGGNYDQDNYRWAKQCSVVVKDVSSGSFACSGLENINDNSKRIDMTGNWQQPPPP